MRKETYKKIQAAVAGLSGLVIAISVVLHSYEIALAGILVGILVLYLANKQLDEVIRDERNAMIQYKASTMTLSIITMVLSLGGILVAELSHRGFGSLTGYGYFMAYLGMGIMSLNSLFMIYYGRQMGD